MAMCVGAEVCGDTGECLVPCDNAECFGDFVCDENNICQRRPCPMSCAENERCINQACVTPCVVNSQCEDTEECDANLRRCVPNGTATPELIMSEPEGDIAGSEISAGTESGGMSDTDNTAGFIVAAPTMTPMNESIPKDSGSSCNQGTGSSSPLALFLILSLGIIFRQRRASKGLSQ